MAPIVVEDEDEFKPVTVALASSRHLKR